MAILSKEGEQWVVGGTKHRGRELEEVAVTDPSYLKWMFRKASVALSAEAFRILSEVLEKYRIDPYEKEERRG